HHAAAAPGRNDNEARTSQASAAGGAAEERGLLGFAGEARNEQLPHQGRRIGSLESLDVLPELAPAIIRAFDVVANPDFLLVKERGPRLPEAFAIALEDGVGGIAAGHLHFRRELDAGREANEIESIRHDSRLIEIVYAPYPSPVGIVPRPEILQ